MRTENYLSFSDERKEPKTKDNTLIEDSCDERSNNRKERTANEIRSVVFEIVDNR